LVSGTICIILGALTAGFVANGPYPVSRGFRGTIYYRNGFTTGEGIWCGVWVSHFLSRNISEVVNLILNF